MFLLAAAIVSVGAAPAIAKPLSRCNAHRAHATKVTPRVIVYQKVAGSDDYGGTDIVYFGCSRPAGRSIAVGIGSFGDGEYPGNFQVLDLLVRGTYVGDLLGSGYADAAACSKYDPTDPNCGNSIHLAVHVADVRARRELELPVPSGVGNPALSPEGALAWVQPTSSQGVDQLFAIVLHPGRPGRLTGTRRLIDSGAIGAALWFSGLTLSWTNSGQPKSQRLR
jgi:hypothetical protein